MIVPDVNLLIYAVNRDLPQHDRARHWLESSLSGLDAVGLPGLVLTAFLRLTTNARIFEAPLEVSAALNYVNGWLHSADHDFHPFPGLKFHNPLADHLLQDPPAGY